MVYNAEGTHVAHDVLSMQSALSPSLTIAELDPAVTTAHAK